MPQTANDRHLNTKQQQGIGIRQSSAALASTSQKMQNEEIRLNLVSAGENGGGLEGRLHPA
jgi:hypothetical protein